MQKTLVGFDRETYSILYGGFGAVSEGILLVEYPEMLCCSSCPNASIDVIMFLTRVLLFSSDGGG